jgi:thioredoxin-like negative regulator of GroEL
MNHALVLFAAGRLDEAKSQIVKTLELSPDFGPNAEIEMVRILVAQRQYAEARARAVQLPDDGTRDHGLALLFDSPEYRGEADAALDRLARSPKDEMTHCIRLAEAYALRGMPEPAFAALGRYTSTLDAADRRTASKRWWMQQELGISPFLKALHDDPRWVALMAQAG